MVQRQYKIFIFLIIITNMMRNIYWWDRFVVMPWRQTACSFWYHEYSYFYLYTTLILHVSIRNARIFVYVLTVTYRMYHVFILVFYFLWYTIISFNCSSLILVLIVNICHAFYNFNAIVFMPKQTSLFPYY